MDSKKIIKRWASSQDLNTQLAVSESLIDGLFGIKVAAESMDDEAKKILSGYVAFTRALYLLHQQNHWKAQAYGDHLLFQRLYEDAQQLLDDAAERVMGLCGDAVFEGEEAIAKKFEARVPTLSSLLESSLEAEKSFQDVAQNTYDALKQKDMITLGLDDLLMSQASQGEVHIYLLQQALRGLVNGGPMLKDEVEDNIETKAREIIERAKVALGGRKKKPEYKPKDIIEYIEAALKVRPYEEVVDYVKDLDKDLLDQVINILMKNNPMLLKKIFFSAITEKGSDGEIEVKEEVVPVEPPKPEDIAKGVVLL